MSDKEKAYAQLEADLLVLARKYVDIFPEYDMVEHCPIKNCDVFWPHISKNAKYCHVHGEKLTKGRSKLSVAQVLDEISLTTRFTRENLGKDATN